MQEIVATIMLKKQWKYGIWQYISPRMYLFCDKMDGHHFSPLDSNLWVLNFLPSFTVALIINHCMVAITVETLTFLAFIAQTG